MMHIKLFYFTPIHMMTPRSNASIIMITDSEAINSLQKE